MPSELPEKARVAVDFDKTISDPEGGSYFTEEDELPNDPVIDYINDLYISGYTIIIWTARPWSEAQHTAALLTEWGVRYHGLRCEKGSADRYIDDKSYRPEELMDSNPDQDEDVGERVECVCGLEIPPGLDWEPQCRHCERLKTDRWARSV